jgi:hypothetical protein
MGDIKINLELKVAKEIGRMVSLFACSKEPATQVIKNKYLVFTGALYLEPKLGVVYFDYSVSTNLRINLIKSFEDNMTIIH